MSVAVVKIGTSSVTNELGELDDAALAKLCADIAQARAKGWDLVVVLSGAVAAGMPALQLAERPTDVGLLQAIAAVGQPRLVARVSALLADHGLVAGQILMTSLDFVQRSQYLHARSTFERLFELGVVPVVNENDTIADDEIRGHGRIAHEHVARLAVLPGNRETASCLLGEPIDKDGGVSRLVERTTGVVGHATVDGDVGRAIGRLLDRAHRIERDTSAADEGSARLHHHRDWRQIMLAPSTFELSSDSPNKLTDRRSRILRRGRNAKAAAK